MLLPLVSIIVPVYNVAYCLETCLDSIVNQTYKNIEIILIDDGSEDNSGEICEKYAMLDKRIKVLHNLNCGVSHSRNIGIKYSKGEYIVFIDSDDKVDKNYILYLLEPVKNRDYDLVICNLINVYKKNNRIKAIRVIIDKKLTGNIKEDYFSLKEILPFSVLKLFKTEIIKDNSIFFKENFNLSEDELFIYDYLKHVKKYKFINEYLYYYIHRYNNSLSNNITLKNFNNYIKKLYIEKEFFKEMKIYNGNIILTDHAINQIGRFLLLENHSNSYSDFKKRIKLIKKAIEGNESPSNLKRKIIIKFLNGNYFFPIYVYYYLKRCIKIII